MKKKHTSKIPASIRSPLINWYFERCKTSGVSNIRISDIFYWIFFQVMNATHAGCMVVLLYCEASYENWKCQLTIFVQNPMQTLLPDKWITCLLRFIGGTMEWKRGKKSRILNDVITRFYERCRELHKGFVIFTEQKYKIWIKSCFQPSNYTY